jgi:hypothetical protein
MKNCVCVDCTSLETACVVCGERDWILIKRIDEEPDPLCEEPVIARTYFFRCDGCEYEWWEKHHVPHVG